jgi:hypothetical protein
VRRRRGRGAGWALVDELYARRDPDLDVLDLHCADSVTSAAAEISPVPASVTRGRSARFIPRSRCAPVAAGGQELRCGVLGYRMVATMIARTENVDDEVIVEPR